MIINTTSLGLKKNDKIDLNYDEIGNGKFFYDLIYNPKNKFSPRSPKAW